MAAGERSALGLGQDASRYVPIIRTTVVPVAILKLVSVSRIVSFPSHRFCCRCFCCRCFCCRFCLPQPLRLACVLGGAEELLPPRDWWAGRHDCCKAACFVSCSIVPRVSSLSTLRPSTVGVTLVFGCVLVGVKSQSLARFWIALASGVVLFAHCTITIIDTHSPYHQRSLRASLMASPFRGSQPLGSGMGMLAERDPNASGRTSRTSNLSARSRATYRHHGGADKQEHLAPGVMSMLRTSTEMGNIIGVTGDASGFGGVPRGPQRRGASSRLSMASSMSGASSHASRHHRQWPSSSSAPKRSSAREPPGPQYLADTLSPTVMDLPGSSPLVPTRHRSSRNNIDSQRSYSLTNTTQATFRLSSPRSLGSLRGHEPIQRPKSPYVYPTRLRRPTYRPASPVLSDMHGSRPRRVQGHSSQGQGQSQPHGPMRLRIPSDPSLGNQERASGIPVRSNGGHPLGYSNGPQGEVPPVPLQLQPRAVLERRRVFDRSIKGPFSSGSGSTNMRNDSDTPSSDLPSPPTPPDGSSLEVLISPTGTQVFVDNNKGVAAKEDSAHGTLYYDYSEQFEREAILEPEVNPIQTGLVQAIKTTQVEHGRSESRTAPARGIWRSGSTGLLNTAVPGMVELPASPVARRITRDMILQALEPASTTEGVDDSGDGAKLPNIEQHPQHELVDDRHGSESVHPTTRKEDLNQRFSILSQADSSLINSSTLEFAVRYSIPIVAGGRLDSDAPLVLDKEPPLAPDTALTTEVDMSDLLAGYQHTESTHKEEGAPKAVDDQPVVDSVEERVAESRSSHARRSSGPDSFKSATDVLESEPSEHEPVEDARSNKSCPDAVVEKTPSVKEVDAHSFKTAQDAATPGRSVSMPLAKTPEVESTEAPNSRPRSEAPLPPVPAVLRKPRVPVHDTSFALTSRFRASSRQSMKQSSVSISGSSSTLSASHQPPPVPPRDSSASQEAQRSMGVASWMLFKRWGKKPSKDDGSTKSRYSSRATLQEARPTNSVTSLQTSPGDTVKPPEKALCRESPVPTSKPSIVKGCTPPQVHNAGVSDCLEQRSPSGPESDIDKSSSVVAEPASACSYDGGSTRSRIQSMPARVPKSVDNHRDSKTTTHLTWHDGRSPTPVKRTESMGDPVLAQPASNDETTTNLRLSQYRYPGGLRNLPDLKEESHEDSSLNPSAGNSKNANFRFSDDVRAGVCAWVDDGALLARRSSLGSYRRSARSAALKQTRALPSMNFSQMNLLEKVDEVLQLRSSRSLDDLMVTPPELHGGTPQRPVSAGDMREKYRSFCDRLDQLNTPKDATRTEITGFVTRRVRSPRLLAEIEQVTVPSVNGLTERLSELLPSLKAYYKGEDQGPFAAEEMIMEHAIEDIHEVGGPVQKRSSARLRPLPGSPEMVVIEDVLYTELTNKDKGDRVILAPGDKSVGRAQSEDRANEKTDLTKTPLAELEAPSVPLHRSRTLTVGHTHVRESAESGLTRRSLRSFTSTPTPTDTRPWNFDKNYPWASSTNHSIDISLPGPTVTRQSPRPGPSHLRNTLSDSSTVSTFTTPVSSPFGTGSDSSAHARQLHRFGNLTRNGDQTHAAGERYPTSALTSPTAIFRDNYFGSEASDDDIESQVVRKGKFSLKKRFSSARNATVEDNTRPTKSKSLSTSNNPLELATTEPTRPSAPSITQDSAGEARAFTSNRHTFRNAQGMPSVVYHRHRIIDHLKR